ncbi:MAG TPA: signal recognition particle-docking protein FtsY [Ktedonobacterales bacterium]|nr:signal recognition particle-docking protein FtsY [Ktedonobacterales bacterium]
MFRRIRENLFGQPEAPAEEEAQPDIDEQQEEAQDEPEPVDSAPEAALVDDVDDDELYDEAQALGDLEDEQQGEDAPEESQSERRGGFFRNPFKLSLGRTRQLFGRMNETLEAADDITDDLWDDLEETLITSDVGVVTTERLLDTLRERVQVENLTRGSQLRDALKEELTLMLGAPEPLVFSDTSPITVLLVVGVNGVGKTTSIAKLANILKKQKHRVLLAAGDTFRAAATEQIKTWGERIGVPVVSHQHGADPGAVVFDAMEAAQARGTDVLIVDTAGRLHTKYNLMEELKKIVRVLQKYDPEAPHEVLLVIDATTGQNGFMQAKQFVQDAGVSGVILTKLDGTARGGIAFAIAAELGLPIKYVGTGERVNDFAEFDADEFVDALFDEA